MRELSIFVALLHFSHCARIVHSSFLSEDEIHHRRIARDEPSESCNEDILMNFLAEIQVINPESIIKLATLSDIASACEKVKDLDKIDSYLKTCTSSSQADLYIQLIKGVDSLDEKLCSESSFKKKFEKIHKCVHELSNDFDDCGGPADWNENSDDAAVCKAYKGICDCYYIKTAKVCGISAASTMKELLQVVIDRILTIDCANVKANPVVKDPMPENYIKKNKGHVTTSFALSTTAAIAIIYIIKFYTNI